MKKSSSQPIIKNGEEKEGNLLDKKPIYHSTKTGEQMTAGKYGPWRQDHKSKLAVLERQLQARWGLEDTIDEQLKHFNTHYKAMVPTQLEDVAQILVPKWAPPLEMISTGWLGDWRPSAILKLVQSLARSSYLSSSVAELAETDGILSQLIHEISIEEMVIDEEMAEVQATCILHLPFGPINQVTDSPLAMVQSEFKKIKQVIIKAQQLRYKALEVVVKRVLSQVDAAEFLVAFAGIQDLVHQFAGRQQKNKKSSVSVKDLKIV